MLHILFFYWGDYSLLRDAGGGMKPPLKFLDAYLDQDAAGGCPDAKCLKCEVGNPNNAQRKKRNNPITQLTL